MSASPKRGTSTGSSPGTPRRLPSSGTLSRSRSSGATLKKKELSVDEGSALSDLHKKADQQFEDERRREAEAMKYWDELKKQEQQRYSDEDSDSGTGSSSISRVKSQEDGYHNLHTSTSTRSSYKTRPLSAQGTEKDRDYRSGGRSYVDGTSEVANGLEGPRNWQGKFYDIDEKYKDSMVANAQLYNDKTALVYQVEELKDRLEDFEQDVVEVRSELQREQSSLLQAKHERERMSSDIESLQKQIQFRDDFVERCGLQLPTGEEDEEELIRAQGKGLGKEEREKLQAEIAGLKEEIASMRSNSLLGDQQPRDILQASTRMVSEFKTKLQIAEAENSRLEGTVNRLKGQVTRYRNQVKELEEREDELMKEKRQQSKEIRTLQSEAEDARTEIDLLKRRIEGLKKRRADS